MGVRKDLLVGKVSGVSFDDGRYFVIFCYLYACEIFILKELFDSLIDALIDIRHWWLLFIMQ
jgi:hypothetical protein